MNKYRIEERTKLKENRNGILWCVWFGILLMILVYAFVVYGQDKDLVGVILFGFVFLSFVYRVVVYSFNSLLLFFFRRKVQIKRLQGKVTPIYKVENNYNSIRIEKFSVKFTPLDLKWSVPFSVLFEEQEYTSDGYYDFEGQRIDYYSTIDEDGIRDMWEKRYANDTIEYLNDISAEEKLKKKLDSLNKVFNENYK